LITKHLFYHCMEDAVLRRLDYLKNLKYMNEGRYWALWTKYLPAIRILLKKAVTEEQQMAVGKLELQSIDTRKNVNFSFNMEINHGKIENSMSVHALGKDLFSVLSGDVVARTFMRDKNIVFEMTRATMLKIRCNLSVPA
jgi:hypothetical protein